MLVENASHGRKGDLERERAEEVGGFEPGGEGQDRGSGSGISFRAFRASNQGMTGGLSKEEGGGSTAGPSESLTQVPGVARRCGIGISKLPSGGPPQNDSLPLFSSAPRQWDHIRR